MKKKELRVPHYLDHILEAIGRIHQYTDKLTKAAFLENRLVQDAVLRNIEIIGEATQNIQGCDPEFIAKHTDIRWRGAYEMRNVICHGYFSIDLEIVWTVVQRDIPVLEQQILKLREDLKTVQKM